MKGHEMDSIFQYARTHLFDNYKMANGDEVAIDFCTWYEIYRDPFCDALELLGFKTDEDYSALLAQMNQSSDVGEFLYDELKQQAEIAAFGLVLLCRLNEEIQARVTNKTIYDFFWQHEQLFECFTYVFENSQRRSLGSQMARRRHAQTAQAKAFVRQEWGLHKGAYDNNKSAFARDYVRRVMHEFKVTVTEKQLREVWLKDNPLAVTG